MIKVRNLVAAYGDTIVLDDISLEVESRDILVIMGQSGCGKSTFLRHLLGLQRPVSGTIEIDGVDVTEMGGLDYRAFCRTIGVLFQTGGLLNSMTVGDNVAFPLHEHTQLAEEVIDIVVRLKLQQVGMRDVESLMPSELSGGMKRRAGLARALALDPHFLFLDEPTSGLDPIIAAGIDELIVKIRQLYRATVVAVSHDIASGLNIADRIAIFRDRAVVQVGTPEEIQASDDPYVRQFFNREADRSPPHDGVYSG